MRWREVHGWREAADLAARGIRVVERTAREVEGSMQAADPASEGARAAKRNARVECRRQNSSVAVGWQGSSVCAILGGRG